MEQFTCPYDGEVLDEKSRFGRHMASAHPPPAVSAGDIEKVVASIDYPKSKRALIEYAAKRAPADSEVMRAVRALPERTCRDAAEVAIVFGEEKAGRARAAKEPPSVRGGHAAASGAVSAAAIAKILGGIDFPKTKPELIEHARRNQERVADPRGVIAVIERLPERRYKSTADVETDVGRVLLRGNP